LNRWYIEKGPDFDVVMSSRVRLARNFKQYPFPSNMNEEQAKEVINAAKLSMKKIGSEMNQNVKFINMLRLEPLEKQAMVEKHIISPEMAQSEIQSGVIITNDERFSIMINEEDHLRIQTLFSGMQLNNAWDECNKLDDILEQDNEFAFDVKYGYLTCCPTNVGTGIRTSVMLHLPALTMTGYIKRVLDACNKLGITVRGLYGENSGASGNMFQISNQVTLGQSEYEIVSSVAGVTRQIIDQERKLRSELYSQNPYKIEDRVYRSLGIISNTRIISSEESMRLFSDVRLGINMGIIKNIDIPTLNELTILIQPASLQKEYKEFLGSEERDIKRAELIRSKLC